MKKKFYFFYVVFLVLMYLLTGCSSKTTNEIMKDTEEVKYEESLNDSEVSKDLNGNSNGEQKGIKIYYKANSEKSFAYYNENEKWITLPGKEMSNSTDKIGYKEITFSGNKVAIMFNDGNDKWDSIGKRKVMYIIIGKGNFIIENHQIKKIKPLKSKYNSMYVKGEFSLNEPVKMTLVEDYTWQTTLYGKTSFTFDIYGVGTAILGDNENDGITDKDGNSINIDSNKYKVTFYEKTKTYKVEKQEIIPQVVKDFSIKVLENNTLSIFIDNIIDKPDGIRVYKSLSRDGEYKLYNQTAYTGEKWENQACGFMTLNEIGNEEGLAYYIIKSYVGDKESEASEIIELKVGKYHNPLAKLDNVKVDINKDGKLMISCFYNYSDKPDGIRVYKSLNRDGKYEKISELKFGGSSGIATFKTVPEIGNEEGYAYYYVVPFIGDKEGVPTEIYELKVIPYHNPLAKLEKFNIKLNESGYTIFSWQYYYEQKPNGIRVYKSLKRDGEYVKLCEIKLSNDSLAAAGGLFRKETGNEQGYAYYYAVTFIGDKEGVPTDIIEAKVQ